MSLENTSATNSFLSGLFKLMFVYLTFCYLWSIKNWRSHLFARYLHVHALFYKIMFLKGSRTAPIAGISPESKLKWQMLRCAKLTLAACGTSFSGIFHIMPEFSDSLIQFCGIINQTTEMSVQQSYFFQLKMTAIENLELLALAILKLAMAISPARLTESWSTTLA